jgi:hypothetical protein
MTDVAATDIPDQRSDPGSVMIYFYGDQDEKSIKIGQTAGSPAVRAKAFRGQSPASIRSFFLTAVRGMPSDERLLHRYFANERIYHKDPKTGKRQRTEWFAASQRLCDYIQWLKGQHFAAQSDACRPDDLPFVSAEQWLPAAGRGTPEPLQLGLGEAWTRFAEPDLTGDDFYTDASIIAAARRTLGVIDLDPASHPRANEVVRASSIFTHKTNGLVQSWYGRVWLNPPFGKWELWTPKIVKEWDSGRISQMCVLMADRALSARCNTPLKRRSMAMVLFDGRIPFWGHKATSSPDDGHAIFYFGDGYAEFKDSFKHLGTVFKTESEADE